jgi:membrane protein
VTTFIRSQGEEGDMKEKFKAIIDFVKTVFEKFGDDKAPKLGAALSFYTIFSLAPLLIIIISIAGLLFGADAARGELVGEIRDLIGEEGAQMVQTALKNSANTQTGLIALVSSFIALVIGSTFIFIDLQDSLNMIWKVKPKPGRNFIKVFIKDRFQSFALVVATGFLLLVSLIVSAGITAINNFLSDTFLPVPVWVLDITNIVISFGVVFLLFAMIYKVLPDVHITLKDVRIGAAVTTALFIIGKYLIGLYLGTSTLSSTYGAAGSLVILLLWVYYSAQILYLGAEFTQVYANRYGSGIRPTSKFEKYGDENSFSEKQDNKKVS